MKNIYETKNYKFLVLIPILLLFISLYYIPKIQLDSSLKGGIDISIQTYNSVNNTASIALLINQKISGADVKVSKINPNNLSITLNANTSLANAESSLLLIYNEYKNYSNATLSIAKAQILLQNKSITNSSSLNNLIGAQKLNQSKYLSQMNSSLKNELIQLSPIISTTSYNSSNAKQMITMAQTSFTNASSIYKKNTLSLLNSIIPFKSYSYNAITPTLGQYFLQKIKQIVIISFILVAIAVFFIFRNPIPSMAVVFGAGNDIIVALGAMGLFGIPLGVASIGAILMLIGYSMDTDLLTAIRILKRSDETATKRAFSTLKTGLTMTSAAIISFSVLFIVSYITGISTFFEISAVVLFGLIADIFTTWFGNTTLILWYKHHKDNKSK
ncbi:MAG: hypothetical protein QXP35_02220 [Candidatus Micrarchaeaceae archaeon]|nr:hypothetical protein [Candidatus Marsarchaeota archaeon]